MNLHEECLLKYLLNPLDLINSTEALKINNNAIERSLLNSNIRTNSAKVSYTVKRI